MTDARTGAPLNRVLVLVEGGAQTLTDANGRFSIAGLTPGAIRVFVSVVGYALVQRTVELRAGTTDLEIPMTEGTGTYTESVTVRAKTFRSAETGVPAHQSLGSADLQNLRGVLADDPLRAVQVLPGVATGDDLRSEFSVRGADFSHMNFTVEGFATPFLLHTVRAVEDRAASGSVAMINSDILEDVTLLNGGYPQRSGNRTGAELSLRLREGSRDRTQARIAVSGTSAAIVADGPIGGSRLGSGLVSARKSYLDLLLDFDLSAEQRLGARSRVVLAVFNREDRHGLRRPGAETKLVGNRLGRGSPDAPYESRLDGYARGIELLVERRDPNGFSGWFAYSYGRNRYVDTVSGESFWGDLDQRHAVNAWLLYRLSARTSVSGKVRFGSNFPAPGYYREEGGRYYVASERNELRAPAYTRLDVRANRTFNWSRKRLTLFAEVMNVFNRDNVRFNPPAINTLTREARFLFEEMIPIVPSAGVLIEF